MFRDPYIKVGVVILAGGLSSRMGSDKARLCDRAQGTFLSSSVSLGEAVLGNIGQDSSKVFVSGDYEGYRCVIDKFIKRGPLAGIHASLEVAQSQGIDVLLFMPIDMPNLGESALMNLLDHFRKEDCSGACFYKDRELPFVLRVSPERRALIERLLGDDNDDRSLASIGGFLAKCGAREVESEGNIDSQFININTPSEYLSWRSADES